MQETFKVITGSEDFMAHGMCLLWEPTVLWLHVVSDVLIGMAYYSIPVASLYFVWKRRDIPIWLFLLWAVVFASCGTTHFMGALTVWAPVYWQEGSIKAFTAVVSLSAAVALIPYIPKALTLPSMTKHLDEINKVNEELEERVAERTVQLETSNKELEAFAYSVSHDLRAPLRSIDGFSQALLEDYAEKLDDTGKDYLNRVRAGSQHMAELIDEMLMLSRITRSELRRETVELSRLAKEVAENLQETQPERKVEFVFAEGVVAKGDEKLLMIVLENLLGNAWKFTSKNERAKIEFGTTETDGRTTYFVRDDGAGFDQAYADKLFGAFQRLHSADEFAGSGIGLATVQRIIHRHGGRVWAEGAVGKGATFYFTLG